MTTTETTSVPQVVDAPAYNDDSALQAITETANAEDTLDIAPDRPLCEMKFTLLRDDLLKVLRLVMKAAGVHSAFPILSRVLVATRPSVLEKVPAQVIFTCSNMETSISVPCNAEIAREGIFALPAKHLLDNVKSFARGKRITIDVVEPYVRVQCGKRVLKLKGGMDASEFPTWSEMILGEGAPLTLDTDILRQAIKEVQFAATEDYSSPVLTHVYTHIEEETLTLVALDSYRMAARTIPLPTSMRGRDATLLIPVASMRLLTEVIPEAVPVVVIWDKDKTQAMFQAGQLQVWTQLGKGTFPNYTAMIPQEISTSFTLPRKDLDQIVKAFKPFAQDSSNIFKLRYNGEQGTVGCLAESEDLGEAYDEIKVPIEGAAGQIIFNIRYLIDLLKYVPVDAFVFKLTEGHRPAVIIPLGRQDYSMVIMPMSSKY